MPPWMVLVDMKSCKCAQHSRFNWQDRFLLACQFFRDRRFRERCFHNATSEADITDPVAVSRLAIIWRSTPWIFDLSLHLLHTQACEMVCTFSGCTSSLVVLRCGSSNHAFKFAWKSIRKQGQPHLIIFVLSCVKLEHLAHIRWVGSVALLGEEAKFRVTSCSASGSSRNVLN